MERLTERKRNNDGSGISTNSLVVENGMRKGFPSSHCGRIVTKLADYEDLDEQGSLLRLPCKLGDTEHFTKKIYVMDFMSEETGFYKLRHKIIKEITELMVKWEKHYSSIVKKQKRH